jgi:hypothetical protein
MISFMLLAYDYHTNSYIHHQYLAKLEASCVVFYITYIITIRITDLILHPANLYRNLGGGEVFYSAVSR